MAFLSQSVSILSTSQATLTLGPGLFSAAFARQDPAGPSFPPPTPAGQRRSRDSPAGQEAFRGASISPAEQRASGVFPPFPASLHYVCTHSSRPSVPLGQAATPDDGE